MEVIWAPWRADYIKSPKPTKCIFCEKPAEGKNKNKKNLILFQGKLCFVIMNLYPYNNGHIMISPYRHFACYSELTKSELEEFSIITQEGIRILKKVYAPHGLNIGINNGRVAGAGIEDHLHLHIVPRWNGDSNFMPVIGKTKVISEKITDTYARLRKEFKKITPDQIDGK